MTEVMCHSLQQILMTVVIPGCHVRCLNCRLVKAQTTAEAECRHRLTLVQSHMFELSKDVSLVELALELAEARYNIMRTASGTLRLLCKQAQQKQHAPVVYAAKATCDHNMLQQQQ